MSALHYYDEYPSADGKYGKYGGRFVPETLMPAILELEQAYYQYREDPQFLEDLQNLRNNYMGRPTPLYFASHLSEKYGCKIYLKREDLLHGGAHKLNNTIGQALLAKKMGKKKLIAETGAGQHGFATAIAGALMGMPTTIFMGALDVQRQSYNVNRMRILGANVVPVMNGSQTLKDAVSEGLRYWISNVDDSYYCMGSVVGPHPFPLMVRDFQKIIGSEIKDQILKAENRLPTSIVACVGGGSNAMGAFFPFIEDEEVELFAVEAAGEGPDTDFHALSLSKGKPGIFQGAYQMLLQDENRNIKESHSIAAGLDYPGKGPEICFLKSLHRLLIGQILDKEAIEACLELSRCEGIIPAIESSHAIAFGIKLAQTAKKDQIIVINVSGEGGKDVATIIKYLEDMKNVNNNTE
jgi:tryptophan synthase beta chain